MTAGIKHDAGKRRFSLLPWGPLSSVVDVLEFGARKYAVDNWQRVDNAHERYANAAMRHVVARLQGEKSDPESGLPHLAQGARAVPLRETIAPWGWQRAEAAFLERFAALRGVARGR